MSAPQPGLIYLCQRPGCSEVHFEAHDAPDVALRRAVESGLFHTFHSCPGGGTGICRLVGAANTFATVAEQVAAMKGATP